MTTEATHVARSAAITGAETGLGREIAIGFADKGYRVFGTARTAEEVEEVRQATHGVARLTVCDLTDEDAVRGWAKDTSDALGDAGLDVLVGNAGILTPDFTPADFFRIQDGLAAEHWDPVGYVRLYQSLGLLLDGIQRCLAAKSISVSRSQRPERQPLNAPDRHHSRKHPPQPQRRAGRALCFRSSRTDRRPASTPTTTPTVA